MHVDVPAAALVYVDALSLLTFAMTVLDKARARRAASRIPERVLLGAALIGGSPGLVLGMLVARHKTRKPAFLLPALAIVALHVALVAWWLSS